MFKKNKNENIDNEKQEEFKEENKKEDVKIIKDLKEKEMICKKDYKINIGSKDGGKDVIIDLIKNKPLPKEIPSKFFSTLKNQGII